MLSLSLFVKLLPDEIPILYQDCVQIEKFRFSGSMFNVTFMDHEQVQAKTITSKLSSFRHPCRICTKASLDTCVQPTSLSFTRFGQDFTIMSTAVSFSGQKSSVQIIALSHCHILQKNARFSGLHSDLLSPRASYIAQGS